MTISRRALIEALQSSLLAVVTIVITLGIAEGVLRQWLGPFEAAEENRFLVQDHALGWTNRPDFSSVFLSKKKGYHGRVSFDEFGLRKNALPRLSSPDLTILVIGDSTTAGLEVNDEDTFVSRLEEKFRAGGVRANVINAGVRGYGTDQSYLRLTQLMPVLHPDLVIYLACGNDFSDNVTVKNWYRDYSKPAFRLEGTGASRDLALINSPTVTFPAGEYAYLRYAGTESQIETGFVKPYGVRGWLREHSALYELGETFYYVHLSKTAFSVVKRNHEIEHEVLGRLIGKMNQLAPRLFVTSFTKEKGGDGIGYDDVAELARAQRVPFLDTRPHFEKGPRYDYRVDSHWNEKGHATEADALFAELGAAGIVKRTASK